MVFEPDDIPYVPEERVTEEKQGGMYLILAPELPNCISLNAVGKDIIDLCDGKKTIREITEEISCAQGENPEENLPKILYFFNYLENKQFAFGKPVTPKPSAKIPEKLASLWLNVTYECNLRCRHCHSSFGSPLDTELTTEEIINIIRGASHFEECTLVISGGEPLCRKDITDILQAAAHSFGDRVILITNGLLLTDEMAQFIADLHINVQVSFEGPDQESNDAVRGKGTFKKALQAVRNLKKRGVTPIVRMTLLKTNINKIEAIIEFSKREGVGTIGLGILQRSGRAYNAVKDIEPTTDELIRAYRTIRALDPDFTCIEFEESLKTGINRMEKIDLCSAGCEILSVGADGGVYPCSALMYPEFLAGNVRENPLEDIWKESSVLKKIRGLSVSEIPGCKECPIRYMCGGGCLVDIYWEHGTVKGKTPKCEFLHAVKWDELKQTTYKTKTVKGRRI